MVHRATQVVVLALAVLSVVRVATAQTIADAYASEPLTCIFTPPDDFSPPSNTRLAQTTFVGTVDNIIALTVGPTFNTTDLPGNFSAGQIYTPDVITFTLPYCTPQSPAVITVGTTPGCEGDLFYGWDAITNAPGNQPIPVDPTINGPAGVGIEGQFISRRDVLGPNYRGTVTWFRNNATCPSVNPTFTMRIELANLMNVGDNGVVAYKDSSSGQYKYCRVYGLSCANVPRQTNSNPNLAPYDPRPTLVPVCKQYMPFSTNYTVGSYEAAFGIPGYRGPTNVPPNGVVYMLRADNLPSPAVVYAEVKFAYVVGSRTPSDVIVAPLKARFDPVTYIFSDGVSPAIVSAKYYNPSAAFSVVGLESEYGFLPPCNCGPGGNIVCTSNALVSTATKAQIPNWNAAITFTEAPSCVIFVNAGNDGVPPYAGVSFVIQSGSSGGVGPIHYAWQFTNAPASLATFTSPTDVALVNAVVNAPGTLTVKLVVWNDNNVTRQCSQTFSVLPADPVAVLAPSTTQYILTNTFLTLDGSGSYAPGAFIDGYRWVQSFGPANATLSSTTDAVISFTANVKGTYVMTLVVKSDVSTGSATVQIHVSEPPPPVTPPPPGTGGPPSQGECINPGNNVGNITYPPSGGWNGQPVAPLPPAAPLTPVEPPIAPPSNVDPAVLDTITYASYIFGAIVTFFVLIMTIFHCRKWAAVTSLRNQDFAADQEYKRL